MKTGFSESDSASVETGWEPSLDRLMPRWDARIVESVLVDRPAAETWETLRDFDLMRVQSPMMRSSQTMAAANG